MHSHRHKADERASKELKYVKPRSPGPNENGDAHLAPGLVAVGDARALERCCVRLVPVTPGGGGGGSSSSSETQQHAFDYLSATSAERSSSGAALALAGSTEDSEVEEGEAPDQSLHRWKRVCLV